MDSDPVPAGLADRHANLPTSEFAFPGPLRDRLVAAVLHGSKTTTTSTLIEYTLLKEPLPVVGIRAVVVDSSGAPVAVTETTEVRILRMGEVDLQHAIDEGEGFTSVALWRSAHESFWHGTEFRATIGQPTFRVDDNTEVVLERFRVIERIGDG